VRSAPPLRGQSDASGRQFLRSLADDASVKVSLAAIAGLAAARRARMRRCSAPW